MEKKCPRHPDADTMIPCLGCGRYFCRICDNPRGAGQYCPRCYEEELGRLGEKKGPGPARLRGLLTRKVKTKGPATPKPTPADKNAVEGGRSRPGAIAARLGRSLMRGAAAVWRAPVKATLAVWRFFKGHFPVSLRNKERFEGMPLLAQNWYKVCAVTLGGMAVWVLVVVLTHHRYVLSSVLVAAFTAWAVAWALGNRFDVPVAVIATSLVMLALVLGELIVQVLYRSGLIDRLDVLRVSMRSINMPGLAYKGYYRHLLLYRLLPSAVAAFLVALWPLPRRLGWRGFRARCRGKEEQKPG